MPCKKWSSPRRSASRTSRTCRSPSRAFTADTLKSKGIGDIHALSNLTPNVNLDSGAPFSGDSSVLSASIRGIGQDDFAFNLDPGVGVYLDGVFLARTIGANQNLLDVDRIEILKGPQGTLFGRNTIGGAINIVTHTPGKEQKLEVQATTGNYNRRDFAATADLPISENLLTSITAAWNYRKGYQEVVPYPSGSPYQNFAVDPVRAYPKSGYQSADDLGGVDNQVLRGKALWNASDKLTVTFAGGLPASESTLHCCHDAEGLSADEPVRGHLQLLHQQSGFGAE